MRLKFLKKTKVPSEGKERFFLKDVVYGVGNTLAKKFIKNGDAEEFVSKSPEQEIAKSNIKKIKDNG